MFNAYCFLSKAISYLPFLLLYCKIRLLNPPYRKHFKICCKLDLFMFLIMNKGYIKSNFECLVTILVGLLYYLFLQAVLPGVRWLYSRIYNAFSSSWKGHMLPWLTLFNLSFAGGLCYSNFSSISKAFCTRVKFDKNYTISRLLQLLQV